MYSFNSSIKNELIRLSANYHYNGKSVCIFQIKAFYLKKLHFNCTFSLDPISIIYNYKQGFEELIRNKFAWIKRNL
jgi:hypothetical protein